MYYNYYGIVGLIVFILDIWAIVTILRGGGDTVTKLLWVILILLLPVVGLVLWLLLGSRRL